MLVLVFVCAKGLGAAASIAQQDMLSDTKWVSMLSKRLYERITSQVWV